MNFVLLTLYDSAYAEIGKRCVESLDKHSPSMGMSVAALTHSLDTTRNTAWSKIQAVLWTLEYSHNGDWVIWIDADSLLLRPFDLRGDIESRSEFDILFTRDWNGLCTCFFAAKKTSWTIDFLNVVWFCGDVKNNDDYGNGLGCKWEQNAIKNLINNFKDISQHVGYLDGWVSQNPEQDIAGQFPIHHFSKGVK